MFQYLSLVQQLFCFFFVQQHLSQWAQVKQAIGKHVSLQ